MIKFTADTTYSTRNAGDFLVCNRTAKTVEIFSFKNTTFETRKITVAEGIEVIYPEGKYSQCPVLKAA